MKKMKNLKSIICGAVALVSAFLCAPTALFSAQAEEKETLDMYLIAGQSNASGFSGNAYLTCSETKMQEYRTGYEKVWYRGNADKNAITAYDQVTKLGQGKSDSNFGAEVGMAEIISAQNPDRQSVIVKHAVGGSYLIDNQTNDVSKAYGNWCSPSMRTETADVNLTGKLYNEFIEVVQESVAYYQNAGYEVNLCGTFWMQGEAENGAATAEQYATHLQAFICDMRIDLASTFDNDVNEAPFVIGKIASTFAGGGAGIEAIRAGQDMVANPTSDFYVSQAYTVETKDYIIVDPKTNQPADGCYDRYHFSADDMISIGHDVAIAALNYGKPFVMAQVIGEGSVDKAYAALTGEPVTFTFTPKAHYALKKLTKNGVDVTADMVGNTYTVTEADGKITLVAEFMETDKFALSVDCDKNGATVTRSKTATKYYVGEELLLTVKLKEGYTLEKVTFNGQVLTANANGKYAITIVEGENLFQVTLKAPASQENSGDNGGNSGSQDENETPAPPADNGGEEAKPGLGCGSTIGGVSVATLALVGFVAFARKKDENA